MYKIATFAIIVNLLLLGCTNSESNGSSDGHSQRPASADGEVQLAIPTE